MARSYINVFEFDGERGACRFTWIQWTDVISTNAVIRSSNGFIFRQVITQVACSGLAVTVIDQPYIFNGQFIIRYFQITFFFTSQIGFLRFND